MIWKAFSIQVDKEIMKDNVIIQGGENGI